MSRLIKRLERKLELFGETVSINGAFQIKAFVQVLDTGRMHAYLDDTEAAAVVRPGLLLVAAAGASISVNDTIARDGRTYTVRKLFVERVKDGAVVKIAILS